MMTHQPRTTHHHKRQLEQQQPPTRINSIMKHHPLPCRPYAPAPSPTPQDSSPNSSTRASTGHVPEHRAPCRHVLSPARTAPQNCTCAGTPKCMPPSSQPSILPNNSPSSLEVGTLMVFSYLGNKRQRGQQHLKQQPKTAVAPPPQTASPLAPAGNLQAAPQTVPQSSTCISTCACKQHPRRAVLALAPQAECPIAPAVHQRFKQHRHQTAPQPASRTACPSSTRPSISQSGAPQTQKLHSP